MNELENRFIYYKPNDDKIHAHAGIRDDCMVLAKYFDEALPDSREKSIAMAKIEEAMFWANAAIARSE